MERTLITNFVQVLIDGVARVQLFEPSSRHPILLLDPGQLAAVGFDHAVLPIGVTIYCRFYACYHYSTTTDPDGRPGKSVVCLQPWIDSLPTPTPASFTSPTPEFPTTATADAILAELAAIKAAVLEFLCFAETTLLNTDSGHPSPVPEPGRPEKTAAVRQPVPAGPAPARASAKGRSGNNGASRAPAPDANGVPTSPTALLSHLKVQGTVAQDVTARALCQALGLTSWPSPDRIQDWQNLLARVQTGICPSPAPSPTAPAEPEAGNGYDDEHLPWSSDDEEELPFT